MSMTKQHWTSGLETCMFPQEQPSEKNEKIKSLEAVVQLAVDWFEFDPDKFNEKYNQVNYITSEWLIQQLKAELSRSPCQATILEGLIHKLLTKYNNGESTATLWREKWGTVVLQIDNDSPQELGSTIEEAISNIKYRLNEEGN